MTRVLAIVCVAALGLGAVTDVFAQSSRRIPIENDLWRLDQSDRRLYEHGFVRRPPHRRLGDPSGVVGYTGPPGIIGESVGSYGAYPPGHPGNEDW